METESWTSAGIVEDTRRGLLDEPKWLSSLYFYDEEGSRLFDAICQTEEYYPTRTEQGILAAHVGEILEAAGEGLLLGELGSGSSMKTRVVLEALLQRQGPTTYMPVDVSADFLRRVARRLEDELPGLKVEPVAAEYKEGLRAIGAQPAPRRLVLFLGSSIGNFEPPEQVGLLAAAHAHLKPGDAFLLGTDLVKDPAVLEAAYNDGGGVTAAFNRNILRHLARRLGGAVDPAAFRHVAFWNAAAQRIEMHLESKQDQRIVLPGAGIDVAVANGERIHTENSYKFTVPGVRQVAKEAGFTLERTWMDPDGWFALHLLRV